MKKNKMLRIASIMLIAVMMSTCAISGTFAKYVTSGQGTDSARVAAWGVTVVANGDTFANAYNTDDTTFAEAQSVVSNGGDDVVAPGTKGDMASMALIGTPEVAVRVTYNAVFDVENWVDQNGSFYCPLVITVNGTAFDGRAYDNAADFELSVNNAIAAYSKDYSANTNLGGLGADSLDVSWEWPFSTSADNDVRDTYLGDQAAAGNFATVQLTVTTTVTQID